MKILAIGEIIFDIFDGEAEIGGAPLNFCAHCVSLGEEAALVSAVGNDSYGTDAVEKLKEFGVKTDFISISSLPTGKCIVTVKNGLPEYDVIRPSAYDDLSADTDKISGYQADVFAFGTLIQREEKSRKAVKKIIENCSFKTVFCDVNLRKGCYDEESCRLCLENAHILKISAEEEPLLAKYGLYENGETPLEKAKAICKAYPNIELVLFTMAENGSLIYDSKKNKEYCIPAEKAELVSGVGAGDSYSAAFLSEYFKSGNAEAAGKAGAERSAFVVAHREAVPKYNK